MKKVGVFLARMQPVHNAHIHMIKTACEECDEVLVFIGSSNKKDTLRNPFDFKTRTKWLYESLPSFCKEKVIVYNLPDWSMENKSEDDKIWGRYFYYNVVSRIGQKHFNIYYSDGQDNLDNWFEDTEVRSYITYRLFERSKMFDGLSATKIREAFRLNDFNYVKKFCPKPVVDDFHKIRKNLLEVFRCFRNDYEME